MATQMYITLTIFLAPNAGAIPSSMHCNVVFQHHPLASYMGPERVRPLRLLLVFGVAEPRCLNILRSMTQYH